MLNNVCFQGRMVADPELRTTQSGVSVLSFTVAWSEKYKEIERKCFLRCQAWRQTAEFIGKYFCKGQEVLLQGKLNTEEWEDKDTGKKRSNTILSVEQVNFCGKKEITKNVGISMNPQDFEEIGTDEDLLF